MSRNRLQQRLQSTERLLDGLEQALEDLLAGNIQSFTLNTSQTVETVTKFNLSSLNREIDALYNRCAIIESRMGIHKPNVGRPGF